MHAGTPHRADTTAAQKTEGKTHEQDETHRLSVGHAQNQHTNGRRKHENKEKWKGQVPDYDATYAWVRRGEGRESSPTEGETSSRIRLLKLVLEGKPVPLPSLRRLPSYKVVPSAACVAVSAMACRRTRMSVDGTPCLPRRDLPGYDHSRERRGKTRSSDIPSALRRVTSLLPSHQLLADSAAHAGKREVWTASSAT